ncbi:DUF5331 domain-containing protein [Nostoc sp. ATCC 53789]|uniref:DUF5331 domain-containing protein n=1 Tax=Nostoc sp. ATCC 53789 TaxID=76335 RepID=UPI000E025F93|nr:DUF5331 domain-containing protein [Nostoc sp. ATCC 53789]QHG15574.1 hypothetical protein GJB62_06045 [Nostoc sp. ATCC 53789]RCJ16410.1 hypothetical protein A6V25_08000 [Nostoc sp. ATCC 53789]
MNIQQLRQSLKQNWLVYYEQNISWLVKMRIWGTYDGLRRPLSGFILATLSVLEPQFDEILAFMLDLNNDPDKIIAALGLNFNPDEELRLEHSIAISQAEIESPDEKHSEDKHLSSIVTASKIVPTSLAKTLDSNLSRADRLAPLFTATTEIDRTPKPELVVASTTKIAPDTPVKTPSSGFLNEYQSVRSDFAASRQTSPLERFPSGTSSLTMIAEANSKAKTMPSVALASEVKSNAPSIRIPVGALLAITTEINSNGKPVRSLAITTEVKSSGKQANIQPQDVKSKVNLPTTNARSLASWVDEFCYGTRNKEEDILT